MAFLNTLFSVKGDPTVAPETCSERLFHFTAEQVRVVLFRECDFRGRKLLFDSQSVIKEVVVKSQNPPKYIEVSNGYGYLCVKPNLDISQMAEMVFGSVAMSYKGTSFKMHSLKSPSRLMCTQVFLSPRPQQKASHSAPNQSCVAREVSNLEQSMKLDDSGVSSANSMMSDHSVCSDTLLVHSGSLPLDVPKHTHSSLNNNLSPSGDFRFSNEQSCNSCNSMSFLPQSDILSDGSPKFSSGSLYKKWLRSTSLSLDCTDNLLSSYSSADDCLLKLHGRGSKLGLSIIIEFPTAAENIVEQFIMEHIALIESILWRARQGIEMAYMRCLAFVSLMFEVSVNIKRWIVDLLSAPQVPFAPACDIWCSISDISLNGMLPYEKLINGDSYTFVNLSKLLRGDWTFTQTYPDEDFNAKKYITELCQLLEEVDAKSTNFFISTLVTAVLTHHLGWVSTVNPPTLTEQETFNKLRNPSNPLWGQLADLYGAVGFPTKLSRTVITGMANPKLISRILNSLTYFIRCGNTKRKLTSRADISKENEVIDEICHKKSCIPRQNYKKYEDHLREIEASKNDAIKKLSLGADCKNGKKEKFETIELQNLGEVKNHSKSNFVVEEASNRPNGLKKIKSSHALNVVAKFTANLNTIHEERQRKTYSTEETEPAGVVFTLGEDEQLLNVKKLDVASHIPSSLKEMSESKTESNTAPFDDEDFEKNRCDISYIKPSSSFTSLNQILDNGGAQQKKPFVRCSSEPPESKVDMDNGTKKSKYRYSGVKFNIQQYPQIVHNYMRSKNIEMSQLPFAEKAIKLFDEGVTSCKFNFASTDSDSDDSDMIEALQTPSNASELEFVSDSTDFTNGGGVEKKKKETKNTFPDNKMQIINLPMPVCKQDLLHSFVDSISYTNSLIRGVTNHYIPDVILQGIVAPSSEWESAIRSDLLLSARHPLLDQQVDEAVAIIGNTDTWEVQLISSHTYVVDKGSLGVRVGMSQLVANMLESLLHMWKRQLPAEFCILHIEQTLQEFCVLSKALAELLLATEFCNIETLTSVLQLELNDVPLLMAVAATHSPQVTQKYGISFH